MSSAKVVDVIAQGETIEGAIQSVVAEASESKCSVQSVHVQDIQTIVEDNAVVMYQLNCKLEFIPQ